MTHEVFNRLRDAYTAGMTKPMTWRREQLHALRRMIMENKQAIIDAVAADLGKPASETLLMEIDLVLSEANFVRRRMRWWSARHPKPMHWLLQPAVGWTINEPKGVVLIISPWNYPVLLSLEPMVDAIAAGNAVCLKPSELSPHISHLTAELIERYMDTSAIAVVEGGPDETTDLLAEPFDHIFYTGGGRVGRIVMKAASEHLTPVTLELGGKSPCFVDGTVNLATAARRIAWGKFTNAGQTCVAPDYVLAESCIKDEFVRLVKEEIQKMYGENPLENPLYGKIINQKHFDRILGLIDKSKTVHGGESNPDTLQIAPTVLDGVEASDPVMQEEIFGPVLPVLTVASMDDACSFVKDRPSPLACYIFTEDKNVERRFLKEVPFGGGCVNDTVIHLATPYLGFGGVGNSGMGSYHGKKSFQTFSHEKSILKKATWLDLTMRYQPYDSAKEKLVRFFVK